MGETKIEWAHYSFNPWWGCTKVSPGCTNCYAERDAIRYGHKVWGPTAGRRYFGDKHWLEPLRWEIAAMKAGVRRRVFCASMADLFEEVGNPGRDFRLDAEREKLYRVMRSTPRLEWLLLTKRPENIRTLGPTDGWPRNVRVGVSVESAEYTSRIVTLLESGAPHPWVSYEPALGPVDFRPFFSICNNDNCPHTLYDCRTGDTMIDWVIVGGESGPGARPFDLAWARSTIAQCRAAGVACFVKQIGALPYFRVNGTAAGLRPGAFRYERAGLLPTLEGNNHVGFSGWVRDRKGGDPQEWPEDLRIREFPR